MSHKHLPATRAEMNSLGWKQPDVIIVTGDSHVDHPSFPAAIIGRTLEAAGFRVCILARPAVKDPDSIKVFGEPALFWGVTAGALDSMMANYTASRKHRSDDPYAAGGMAGGRPDRALTVYCNMIRKAYGKTAFIVAGGIEASLRKFAHYDFWSDSVRRPILMDCGANILVHGMGEGPVRAIAATTRRLASAGHAGRSPAFVKEVVDALIDTAGIAWRAPKSEALPSHWVAMPSAEEVASSLSAHARAWQIQETSRARTLCQESGGMRVVANPPWTPTTEELDAIYALPFTGTPHPVYQGRRIPAYDTVAASITSHRGCFGGCAFCAIGAHQGKTVVNRSASSVLDEVARIARRKGFSGTITDIGGPTANMYGAYCGRQSPCDRPSCLWPARCKHLVADQETYLKLLGDAERCPGVKHVFIGSGIRMELAMTSEGFCRALALRHTSGYLKVAPEHLCASVLELMRKPAGGLFERFVEKYRAISRKAGREQYVVPYLMAAHPGCSIDDMRALASKLRAMGVLAEQCQIFTPSPGTAATVMYATGLNPANMKSVFVEKSPTGRDRQKAEILHHINDNRRRGRKL